MQKTVWAWLLSGTAVLALVPAASAQDKVERLDDGSIEVTSDVGDTVVFPPGTLGSLIEDAWKNGGAKPFEGQTISVVTLNAGPRGAISGGILPWEAAWEELTGSQLDVVLRPFNDLAPVIFNDLFTETGAYDGFVPPMVFLGDMKDYLLPLNEQLCDPRFPKVFTDAECQAASGAELGMETLMPAIQPLFRWGDQWYAVPWDIDSHVQFYRKDIIESPEIQAAYEADTGRKLRVPQSLQEMQEIGCYFQGKDPLGNGQTLYGFMQPGGPNSQLFDWYKDIAGAWVTKPGGAGEGFREVTFSFDPDTMDPLINSPGHVAALQWMIDSYACGPQDFASIDLGAHFNRFVQGEAVFAWSAGDIAALAQEEGSKVKGNIGLIPIPGSTQVEKADGTMATVDPAVPNYNVYGASWSGEVSKFSDNPEATYALFAFLGSQPMRNWNVKWGFDGIDIGRRTDFLPPDGTSDIEVWKAGGFDENDARNVSHGIFENLSGPVIEYFKIPGAAEYNLALELAVQQALTGQVTAQEALDSVAGQWREITDRLGVEEQRAAYRETLGLDG